MALQWILDDCGLNIIRHAPVNGGDINQSYCLHGTDAKYFLKVNDASSYPGMLEKEMNGLKALAKESSTYNRLETLTIPGVIKSGVVQQQQYLLLEWIETGILRQAQDKKDFWEKFGTGLALMHQKKQPYFGWDEDNYIGSLPQCNAKHETWNLFYAECRIMPLIKMLFDNGVFSKHDVTIAESICKQSKQIFPPEPPALLHGDLWSGNFLINATGDAAIYDPAVYYGHREMDIGMTKLFGGFDQRFYDAYNEMYPMKNGWQQRLSFSQLYPLLVHAVLFGGEYVGRTKEIMQRFIKTP